MACVVFGTAITTYNKLTRPHSKNFRCNVTSLKPVTRSSAKHREIPPLRVNPQFQGKTLKGFYEFVPKCSDLFRILFQRKSLISLKCSICSICSAKKLFTLLFKNFFKNFCKLSTEIKMLDSTKITVTNGTFGTNQQNQLLINISKRTN